MLFSRIFEFSNRNLIRYLNSLSPDIVSSVIRAKVSIPTTEYFGSLIQKKEIKIKQWKNDIIDGTNQIIIYPSDLDSFTKICSNNNLFITDKIQKSGTLVIPNRISIQIKTVMGEKLRNEIRKHPKFSYNLLGDEICHLFVKNSEDFNSLFFMNTGGLHITRAVFPYMYKTTLKITPNILSVVLPPDVDTVLKAANIFAAYGFNRISKPSSTGSWLFYLQNEADYMKMLSTPNYYLDKVLPVMPYYGTPLIYTPGDKESGKIIHIYHNSPAHIGRPKVEFKNFLNFASTRFDNKRIDSYYFTNTDDFNALKFSNGLNLYNGYKYTMVIGDEISSENINSPYLVMKLQTESESDAILGKINATISYYNILKLDDNIFLRIIPKSFVDYKNILATKFESDNNNPKYFYSLSPTPKGSFLLNSFVISEKFYNENKTEIDNNKEIILKKVNSTSYVVACEQNKCGDVLFYLSNLSRNFYPFYRSHTKIFDFDKNQLLVTMKRVAVPASKLSSILPMCKNSLPSTITPSDYDDMRLLIFNDVSNAYPYLFSDYSVKNVKKSDALNRVQAKLNKSMFIINQIVPIEDSASLIHSLNIDRLLSKDNFTHYQVNIKSLHDYANAISFCDSINGSQNIKFMAGNDILSL